MQRNEILMIYGDDPSSMAKRLAEEADIASLIGDKGKRIGLKPNLVVSKTAASGATTHPEIAAGLIAYLQERGFNNIVIAEGSWVGDSTSDAFSVCGYRALAEKTGVDLVDTQRDTAKALDCKGMKIEICDTVRACDFMINLPVMKGHCQTLVTCALKNNKGIMPDREKQRFHSLGLHKPIAHLNTAARNDFIVVDGICGDLDFEEGGNPVYSGRMFAARDPVLCDAFAAGLMGYAVDEIPYIRLAEDLGVGSADLSAAVIRELNRSEGLPAMPRPQGKARELGAWIAEDKACSACYAALVFALSRLSRADLQRLPGKIACGQGYRGKKDGGVGSGLCTAGLAKSCPGCPPSGSEALAFLRGLVGK